MIEVRSPLNASVWKLEVSVGDSVAQYDALLILEAMKTEIPVEAPADGMVTEIKVAEGQQVSEDQVVMVIAP